MITTDPDPRSQDERVRACRTSFEGRMAARGLARQREGADGASFGWLDSHGITGRDFLASYARVFDNTVTARPESVSDGPRIGALPAAFFESGRPGLLQPPGGATHLGAHTLIPRHWTPEADRPAPFP